MRSGLRRLLGLPVRLVRRVWRMGRPPESDRSAPGSGAASPSMVGRKHEPTADPSPEEKARKHRRRAKAGLLLWLRDGAGVATEAVLAERAASVYFLDGDGWASLLAELRAEDLVRDVDGGLSVSDAGRSYAEGTH